MEKSQLRWLFDYGVETIRYEGFHILCWRMFRWSISIFGDLKAISFCRKDLTIPMEEIKPTAGLIISQATEDDVDQVVALTEKRWTDKQKQKMFKIMSINDTIKEQLSIGSKCFIGKIDSEIVHYNWIFFNKKDFDNYFIRLQEREALCDDAFTLNEWRGKGIHGAVHNRMLIFLQQSGFHTAYTRVGTDNISSKKALQRLGWDFYGTLVTFTSKSTNKVLMWQIHGPLDPFTLVK